MPIGVKQRLQSRSDPARRRAPLQAGQAHSVLRQMCRLSVTATSETSRLRRPARETKGPRSVEARQGLGGRGSPMRSPGAAQKEQVLGRPARSRRPPLPGGGEQAQGDCGCGAGLAPGQGAGSGSQDRQEPRAKWPAGSLQRHAGKGSKTSGVHGGLRPLLGLGRGPHREHRVSSGALSRLSNKTVGDQNASPNGPQLFPTALSSCPRSRPTRGQTGAAAASETAGGPGDPMETSRSH